MTIHSESIQVTDLLEVLEQLNADERAGVLDVAIGIAERMLTGRQRYAPLDLASDPRDWVKEAFEEAVDGAAYLACAAIAKRRSVVR
jgi:hypothetical protein